MPLDGGVVKVQQMPYPNPDVNPLEATFCLLKTLRDEIREMREVQDEDRRIHGCEIAELAAQLRELRADKDQRLEEVDKVMEEMKGDMFSRFQNLQSHVKLAVQDKNARFEQLEVKVEEAMAERKDIFQTLNKRLSQEAQVWRVHAETSDRVMKDHKRQAEIYGSNSRQRHEELREEVERIAALFRDNSMARDPFRHFPARSTKLPALCASAPAKLSTDTMLPAPGSNQLDPLGLASWTPGPGKTGPLGLGTSAPTTLSTDTPHISRAVSPLRAVSPATGRVSPSRALSPAPVKGVHAERSMIRSYISYANSGSPDQTDVSLPGMPS